MTPKIINASFMAIFDNQDFSKEYEQYLEDMQGFNSKQTSAALRRRVKGLMLSDKQHRWAIHFGNLAHWHFAVSIREST